MHTPSLYTDTRVLAKACCFVRKNSLPHCVCTYTYIRIYVYVRIRVSGEAYNRIIDRLNRPLYSLSVGLYRPGFQRESVVTADLFVVISLPAGYSTLSCRG